MRASNVVAVADRNIRRRVAARGVDLVAAHPVVFVFLVALAVRVFIAAVLTKFFSGTLVLDDTTYHAMAQQMAEGAAVAWDDFTYRLYWSTASFIVPVTFLYTLFGPAPVVGQLFVAVMGACAAAFVARIALEFLAPRWALVAGMSVALLPSQAFWSSMLMKDASVWFVLAGLGATVAVASRATGRHLAVLGLAAGGLLVMLSYLRLHTLVVGVWALMIAAFFGVRQDRAARIAGALVVGIAVPWVFGAIGPAGISLITNHGSLEERRFWNAQGARTAIVPTEPIHPQLDNIPIRELEAEVTELDRKTTELKTEATELKSRANELQSEALRLQEKAEDVESSDPADAKVLRARALQVRAKAEAKAAEAAKAEARRAEVEAAKAKAKAKAKAARAIAAKEGTIQPIPPPAAEGEAPLDPNLKHLPRGLSVMLLEPFPVPFEGSLSLKLARLESLLWYPFLVLAAIGLWNVRPYLRQVVFPLLAGGGIILMYALSEGNVGTAHRHRGEFVWVVILLAAAGLRHVWARHRDGPVEEDA